MKSSISKDAMRKLQTIYEAYCSGLVRLTEKPGFKTVIEFCNWAQVPDSAGDFESLLAVLPEGLHQVRDHLEEGLDRYLKAPGHKRWYLAGKHTVCALEACVLFVAQEGGMTNARSRVREHDEWLEDWVNHLWREGNRYRHASQALRLRSEDPLDTALYIRAVANSIRKLIALADKLGTRIPGDDARRLTEA